jgi:hypothetical protein
MSFGLLDRTQMILFLPDRIKDFPILLESGLRCSSSLLSVIIVY